MPAEPGASLRGLLTTLHQLRRAGPKLTQGVRTMQRYDGDRRHMTGQPDDHANVVNAFYDAVTPLYELGWGDSFHFAPRLPDEPLPAALARLEDRIAEALSVGPGARVLDLGCGIGGPMRRIAATSGASVTGVNNNLPQVDKARAANRASNTPGELDVIHADFTQLSLPRRSFDAAYSLEALCHAPDRTDVLMATHEALRPGARLVICDWCLTDRFDDDDSEHASIRRDIELGSCIPSLTTTHTLLEQVDTAGFDVLSASDLAVGDGGPPWYEPLGRLGSGSFLASSLGRQLTHAVLAMLEGTRIAPSGSRAVSRRLLDGANALHAGGRIGLFTPSFLVIARARG